MKFTAQIIVDIDAETFANAAEHEREITNLFQDLKARYENCRLEIKQRRASNATAQRRRAARPRQTGNLAVYRT